jgi:competence protein ComEA
MNRFMTILLSSVLAASAWATEAVNVNSATAEEIAEALKGVGLSKAQAIVEYRALHGDFKHIDELVNVKGIGLRTVDQNRSNIVLQESSAIASKDD